MSQQNVDLVRALLARWERADYEMDEAFHPEVTFTRTGGASDVLGYGTEAHGMDALRAAVFAWTDEWSDVRVEVERCSAVGERVLVLARHRATGRHSGAQLDHLDGWVFSLRDGLITRWDAYWDPAEAERALGIR